MLAIFCSGCQYRAHVWLFSRGSGLAAGPGVRGQHRLAKTIQAAIDRLDPTVDRLTREAMHQYDRAHQIFGTVEVEIPDIDIANIMHCKGSLHNVRHEYKKAYQYLRMALNDKIEILGIDSIGSTRACALLTPTVVPWQARMTQASHGLRTTWRTR